MRAAAIRPSDALLIAVTLSLGIPAVPSSQQRERTAAVDIRLAAGTELEQRGREQLERILTKWDLSRWLFTRTVQIQSRVIPHSHPVLTLNTQYVDDEDDTRQLATLLHEQLHWFLTGDTPHAAIADLERLYPTVPESLPEGANGRRSTYLHLLVCLLEFDAVRELLGDESARKVLAGFGYYTWVYREVLERPEPIRKILRAHGFDAPDARRAAAR
jgi:hypothetical protein